MIENLARSLDQMPAHIRSDALPGAELIVIPGAGHLTAVEQPQLFNDAVTEFGAALTRTLR